MTLNERLSALVDKSEAAWARADGRPALVGVAETIDEELFEVAEEWFRGEAVPAAQPVPYAVQGRVFHQGHGVPPDTALHAIWSIAHGAAKARLTESDEVARNVGDAAWGLVGLMLENGDVWRAD